MFMNPYKITPPARPLPKIPPVLKSAKQHLFLLAGKKGRKQKTIAMQTESHADTKSDRDRPLQSLGGLLLKTQEEERSRIARELHDDVAQRVVLLCLKINELRLINEDTRLAAQL